MLSVDDTKLTNHSGSANGRPLYLTTANQSLESRRHSSTNSWRVAALLPSLDIDSLSSVEKEWSTVAKAEFVNRSMELVLKPLIGTFLALQMRNLLIACADIHLTGFLLADKRYYVRLICCLCDMLESWYLWGLQYGSCPICVAPKKDFNKRNETFGHHPHYDYSGYMQQYEEAGENWVKRAKISKLMQKAGHYPVRVRCVRIYMRLTNATQLAFAKLCANPYETYIVDILHQPKKGTMVLLLECFRLRTNQAHNLPEITERMSKIPAYHTMEHFNRCWFDIDKMTASNYRDMVRARSAPNIPLTAYRLDRSLR